MRSLFPWDVRLSIEHASLAPSWAADIGRLESCFPCRLGWHWVGDGAASHSQHGLKADFLITQKGDPRDASCIVATTRRPPRTPHAPPGAPRAQRLLPRHPAVWGPEPAFLLSQPRSPTVCPRPERLPVLAGSAELGSLAAIIDPRAPLASGSAGSLGPVCLLAGVVPRLS